MPEEFTNAEVGTGVAPCPLEKHPPPHWIEIELIGEDGKGIAFEEFCLRLPDGGMRAGLLDENGFARVDGLETGGECGLKFPRLDGGAWEFVETTNG